MEHEIEHFQRMVIEVCEELLIEFGDVAAQSVIENFIEKSMDDLGEYVMESKGFFTGFCPMEQKKLVKAQLVKTLLSFFTANGFSVL